MPNALALDKYGQFHPEHIYSFSVTNLNILLSKAHFEPLEVFVDPYLIGKTLSLTPVAKDFFINFIPRLPTKLTVLFSSSYMIVAQKR